MSLSVIGNWDLLNESVLLLFIGYDKGAVQLLSILLKLIAISRINSFVTYNSET